MSWNVTMKRLYSQLRQVNRQKVSVHGELVKIFPTFGDVLHLMLGDWTIVIEDIMGKNIAMNIRLDSIVRTHSHLM